MGLIYALDLDSFAGKGLKVLKEERGGLGLALGSHYVKSGPKGLRLG